MECARTQLTTVPLINTIASLPIRVKILQAARPLVDVWWQVSTGQDLACKGDRGNRRALEVETLHALCYALESPGQL
jgi:hypothetical protein